MESPLFIVRNKVAVGTPAAGSNPSFAIYDKKAITLHNNDEELDSSNY